MSDYESMQIHKEITEFQTDTKKKQLETLKTSSSFQVPEDYKSIAKKGLTAPIPQKVSHKSLSSIFPIFGRRKTVNVMDLSPEEEQEAGEEHTGINAQQPVEVQVQPEQPATDRRTSI